VINHSENRDGFFKDGFIIGEVGLAHDGSLGMAHAFIDAIADAGADAVKFQTHIAKAEGTKHEKFRVNVFPQDATRQDYWKRTSFTKEQWADLKKHCDDKGVFFMSSPFSLEAVELLKEIGVEGWKIGSGETNNIPLLRKIANFGDPVFLSTGMSYFDEIGRAVDLFNSANAPLLLMQCTNKYPCPPEFWGLNLIPEYIEKYKVPIGFSDHSGDVAAGLAAVAIGARAVEVHVTWHKSSFGPDVKASLTLDQLSALCRGVKDIVIARNNNISKDSLADEMSEMRSLFTKSVVVNKDLPAGTKLTIENTDTRKPALGIPATSYDDVLGKTLLVAKAQDDYLKWADLK